MAAIIDPVFHEFAGRLSEAEALLNVLNTDVIALKASQSATDARVARGDRIVAEVQIALQDMRRKLEAVAADWEHIHIALDALKSESSSLHGMLERLESAVGEIQNGVRMIVSDQTSPMGPTR